MRVSSDPASPHYRGAQHITVFRNGQEFKGDWTEFDDAEGWIENHVVYYGGAYCQRLTGRITWAVHGEGDSIRYHAYVHVPKPSDFDWIREHPDYVEQSRRMMEEMRDERMDG